MHHVLELLELQRISTKSWGREVEIPTGGDEVGERASMMLWHNKTNSIVGEERLQAFSRDKYCSVFLLSFSTIGRLDLGSL